jgi:hypothetical protein
MQKSVLVLFLIAGIFYLLGGLTPAIVLGIFGLITEAIAWIFWLANGSDVKNSELSQKD